MDDAGEVRVHGVVTQIVRSLVDDEGAVRVMRRDGEGGVVLDVHVAAGDVGKLIGKQGRTARSLRTILSAMNCKYNVRLYVNIVEATQ